MNRADLQPAGGRRVLGIVLLVLGALCLAGGVVLGLLRPAQPGGTPITAPATRVLELQPTATPVTSRPMRPEGSPDASVPTLPPEPTATSRPTPPPPTRTPTRTATRAPTATRTATPTASPTATPTASPTATPTAIPTEPPPTSTPMEWEIRFDPPEEVEEEKDLPIWVLIRADEPLDRIELSYRSGRRNQARSVAMEPIPDRPETFGVVLPGDLIRAPRLELSVTVTGRSGRTASTETRRVKVRRVYAPALPQR